MSIVIVEVNDLKPAVNIVRAFLMPDVMYEENDLPVYNAGDRALMEAISGLLEYHVGLEQEPSCLELLDLYNEVLSEMLENALSKCLVMRQIIHALKNIQMTDRQGTLVAYL